MLKGEGRAEYGKQVIMGLAADLTAEYGKGFDFTNLYKFLEFYRTFPILDSLNPKSGLRLPWTHYVKLLQVKNEDAREWYVNEAGSGRMDAPARDEWCNAFTGAFAQPW